MESTWTITELAERAVEALSAGESVRVNGRVRDMPNERLIRWYTTIGLVDPPLGRRGRTALYGTRHLLQIVAVKRRQAAGRTIAEIQVELAGATDRRLGEIARLPADGPDGGEPEPSRRREDAGRPRFWAAQPTAATATTNQAADQAADPEPNAEGGAEPAVSLVQGVRLATGLTLLLDGPTLNDDDLAAIETAARPLLVELRRRGLIDRPSPHPDHRPADPSGRSQ
ncbi:MerR family transcriptional regulator [Spirillospora sp. CA-255316]